MEYNTTRNRLTISEYGRHVQKMVEYLLTIEDDEKRQRNAETVIELMGLLNPHLKEVEDWRNKLWDHLFLISDFKLKVNSPYPTPTREVLERKPEPLPYPERHPRFKHFGRNFETLFDKAMTEKDPEVRDGLVQHLGHYMKLAYAGWHQENVHDDLISSELAEISHGKLKYENDFTMSMPESYLNHSNNKRKGHIRRNGKNNGKNRFKSKNRGR